MDDDVGQPVSRRGLLSALGVGVTAGCLQLQDPGGSGASPTERETAAGTAKASTAGQATDTRTQTADTTAAESRTPLEPQAPGNVRWRLPTDGTVTRTPVVADGTVYATTADSVALAFDIEAGERRWRYETKMDHNRLRHAVTGDRLFVSGPFSTEAVSVDSGSFVWGTGSGSKYSPLVRDGVAYLGGSTGENTLRVFDVAADDLLWSFTTDGGVRGRPALVDGTLYVTGGAHDGTRAASLYALDAETGERRWEQTIDDQLSSDVVPSDGWLYLTGESGTVAAVDGATGEVQWRRTIEGVKSAAGAPTPQIANGRLHLADRSVRALDPATGASLWTFEERNFFTHPAIVDGALYVPRFDGRGIHVLDPATGERRTTFTTDLGEPTGLAVGPETLVCGDRTGGVVAIWR